MPDYDPSPERSTQSAGALEPPRRRPPVAIGADEAPPDPPDRDHFFGPIPVDDGAPYRTPSKLRRIALALLAMQAVAVAVVLLQSLGWQGYFVVVAVVVAHAAWYRSHVTATANALPIAGAVANDGANEDVEWDEILLDGVQEADPTSRSTDRPFPRSA